jgi:hypothetical protein
LVATLGTVTLILKLVNLTAKPKILKSKESGFWVLIANGGPAQIKSEPKNRSVSVTWVPGPLEALAFTVRKEQNSPIRVIPVMGSPSRKASPVLVRIKWVTLFSQSKRDWIGRVIPAWEGQEV